MPVGNDFSPSAAPLPSLSWSHHHHQTAGGLNIGKVNDDTDKVAVEQWSKALILIAKGVTTGPGSIPGCITTSCDWDLAQHLPGLAGVGHHCK